MDFSQIESQTALNIHLFIKNYLTRSFKTSAVEIPIPKLILTKMISHKHTRAHTHTPEHFL